MGGLGVLCFLGVDLVTLAFDKEDVTGAEYIVDFGSASPYMAKSASLMPAPSDSGTGRQDSVAGLEVASPSYALAESVPSHPSGPSHLLPAAPLTFARKAAFLMAPTISPPLGWTLATCSHIRSQVWLSIGKPLLFTWNSTPPSLSSSSEPPLVARLTGRAWLLRDRVPLAPLGWGQR